MHVHLEPKDFIQALDKDLLSGRVTVHLKHCDHCRETLHELRVAKRALQSEIGSEPGPEDAFWDKFRQSVRGAIQSPGRGFHRPMPLMGPIRHSLAASVVLVLLSLLLSGTGTRDLPWTSPGDLGKRTENGKEAVINEPLRTTEGDSAGALELLDTEPYLYTEARFYDQIRQELSFLKLGPETLAESDVGLSRYVDY